MIMKKNIKRKIRGFTLIEIVASLGILGLGMLSMLAAFSISMKASTRSARYTEATMVLQRIAEQEKIDGYNSAVVVRTPVSTLFDTNFDYFYRIEVPSFSAAEGWAQRRIIVDWVRYGAKNEEIAAEIFVFDR